MLLGCFGMLDLERKIVTTVKFVVRSTTTTYMPIIADDP